MPEDLTIPQTLNHGDQHRYTKDEMSFAFFSNLSSRTQGHADTWNERGDEAVYTINKVTLRSHSACIFFKFQIQAWQFVSWFFVWNVKIPQSMVPWKTENLLCSWMHLQVAQVNSSIFSSIFSLYSQKTLIFFVAAFYCFYSLFLVFLHLILFHAASRTVAREYLIDIWYSLLKHLLLCSGACYYQCVFSSIISSFRGIQKNAFPYSSQEGCKTCTNLSLTMLGTVSQI